VLPEMNGPVFVIMIPYESINEPPGSSALVPVNVDPSIVNAIEFYTAPVLPTYKSPPVPAVLLFKNVHLSMRVVVLSEFEMTGMKIAPPPEVAELLVNVVDVMVRLFPNTRIAPPSCPELDVNVELVMEVVICLRKVFKAKTPKQPEFVSAVFPVQVRLLIVITSGFVGSAITACPSCV
jgi:hypothetical protein